MRSAWVCLEPMRDDGFTLSETLAALAILSLSTAGLSAALLNIGRSENRLSDRLDSTATAEALSRGLTQLTRRAIATASPDDASFKGESRSFQFSCEDKDCSANLTLAKGKQVLVTQSPEGGSSLNLPRAKMTYTFAYLASDGLHTSWPAAKDERAPPPILRAVEIVEEKTGEPLALATLSRQEARACAFDTIVGGCRKETP